MTSADMITATRKALRRGESFVGLVLQAACLARREQDPARPANPFDAVMEAGPHAEWDRYLDRIAAAPRRVDEPRLVGPERHAAWKKREAAARRAEAGRTVLVRDGLRQLNSESDAWNDLHGVGP